VCFRECLDCMNDVDTRVLNDVIKSVWFRSFVRAAVQKEPRDFQSQKKIFNG